GVLFRKGRDLVEEGGVGDELLDDAPKGGVAEAGHAARRRRARGARLPAGDGPGTLLAEPLHRQHGTLRRKELPGFPGRDLLRLDAKGRGELAQAQAEVLAELL